MANSPKTLNGSQPNFPCTRQMGWNRKRGIKLLNIFTQSNNLFDILQYIIWQKKVLCIVPSIFAGFRNTAACEAMLIAFLVSF